MSNKDLETRLNLLEFMQRKNYSVSVRHKILELIVEFEKNDLKSVVKKAIEIVNQSQTEQEALNKIQELKKHS